jgi:hypothetical protein
MAMTSEEHRNAAEENLRLAEEEVRQYNLRGDERRLELARHYREIAATHARLAGEPEEGQA